MANNQIKHQKAEKNNPVMWICDWNGSNKGLGSIKNSYLSAAVIKQLGKPTADLFSNDFINYSEGLILCMNQAGVLNKFFTVATPTGNTGIYRGISDSIVFKCVRMPLEFKNQKTSLSSIYAYGEKLVLSVSFEDPDTIAGNKIAQVPNNAKAFASNVRGATRMITIYRDLNIKGRSVKGSSSTAGASIGVWS